MSAPGRKLATGRLRVDAARAVAKLRDYQLLERRLWILEALRGAVGAGAESIHVDADADDVWVAWEGAPPPLDELGALLDELVSPAVDPRRRWARLLATAVNTALGEGTRWVDVWRIEGDDATAFRYSPSLLVERDHDDQALRPARRDDEEPAVPHRPKRGVVLQVRRRFGFDVMGRWIARGDAPEIELLHQVDAGLRSRVPLWIGDQTVARDGDILLEVPVGEHGRLVLLEARPGPARPISARWAELGVPLADSEIFLESGLLTRPVPAALLYDSDRLPTNAARSEVRLEEGLGEVVQQARKELRQLVAATCAAFREAQGERRETLRAAILGWVGAHVGSAGWRRDLPTLDRDLVPFRDLPLVRNAVGRWVSLDRIADGPVLVSAEPESEELAPWLSSILWVSPGDPSAALLGGMPVPSPRKIVRDANRALAARRRWLEHEPREPAVPRGVHQWLSLRFGKGENLGRSALPLKRIGREFTGEVCLLDPEAVPPAMQGIGHAVLMREGRPIDEVQLASAIPFVAFVASDEIAPTADYRGAVHGAVRERAIGTVTFAALRAIELLFARLRDPKQSLPGAAGIREDLPFEPRLGALRQALLDVIGRLELRSKQVVSQLRGPFRDAPIFEYGEEADGEGWVVRRASLRQLATRFEAEELIVHVPGPTAPRPAEVPVIWDRVTSAVLRARFGGKEQVTYDAGFASRRLRMDDDAIETAVGHPEWPLLHVDLGHVRGAIAWSGSSYADQPSTLVRLHRGVRIDQIAFSHAYQPCRVALDDDRLIPDSNWTSVVAQPALDESLGRFEQAMCRALVDALGGASVPALRVRGDLQNLVPVQDALLRASLQPEALDPVRRERLRALPLFPTLGGERVSLADLAQRPEPVWLEAHESYLEGLDPQILVMSETRASLVAGLLERSLRHGAAELAEAQRKRRRNRNLELHRKQPRVPMPLAGPQEARHAEAGVEAVVSVSSLRSDAMQLVIRIDGRPFQKQLLPGPPLEVLLDLDLAWANGDFDDLDAMRFEGLVHRIRERIAELLLRVTKHAPALLHDDPAWGRVLDDWIERHGDGRGHGAKKVRGALLEARCYPKVQGGRSSIEAASTPKQVRVAEPTATWLHPAEGESGHHLDSPVLAVSEIHRGRIERLAQGKAVVDVTASVRRLQDQRRVAQGLVERPRLPHVAPELKLPLEDVTSTRSRWRIGEIGLLQKGPSTLLVHAGGELVRSVSLDTLPFVAVALESSNLAEEVTSRDVSSANQRVEQLTRRLLQRAILPRLAALPRWVDEAVTTAFLAGLLKAEDVEGLLLFDSTAGGRVTLADLRDQEERFGDVWVNPSNAYLDHQLQPLEPARVAIRASTSAIDALVSRHGIAAVDALELLRADAKARANRERPAVTSLEIPARTRAACLAQRALDTEVARGTVGLLEGTAVSDGLVHLHHEMKPLGEVVLAQQGWPVVAVVEAPRITPNRMHDGPVDDERWAEVRRAIFDARTALWNELVPEAPQDALAQRRVSFSTKRGLARGRLWLTDARHGGTVRVWYGRIAQTVSARAQDGSALPVRGELWLRTRPSSAKPEHADEVIQRVFQALVERAEKKALAGDREAHAVVLLAALRNAAKVKTATGPIPGLGVRLDELLAARDQGLADVRRALPSDPLADADPAIAAVLKQVFPQWVLRSAKPRAVDPGAASSTRGPEPSEPTPARKPAPKPKKRVRRAHALDPLARALVEAIQGRQGVRVGVVVIPRRRRGLLSWADGTSRLELSGANPLLVALQAQRLAGGPDAERGMRLLLAHAIGVLERALTSVTPLVHRSATLTLLTPGN